MPTTEPTSITEELSILPTYRGTKVVRAAVVLEIGRSIDHILARIVTLGIPGPVALSGKQFECAIPLAVFSRGTPEPGDYIVVYPEVRSADGVVAAGHVSWSPRAVFEGAYHRIDDADEPQQTNGHLFAGTPDARQSDAPSLPADSGLFRRRYRKLLPPELALHDDIKSTADELARLIASLNPPATERLVPRYEAQGYVPGHEGLGRTYDAANVTLALRHLEDAVYRAIKALTG